MDDFRAHMICKRIVNDLDPRGIETQITVDMARRQLAESAEKGLKGKFDNVARELYEFQDMALRQLVDSGVMSRDTYNAMKKLNKYYVPFYRLVEGADLKLPFIQKGRKGVGKRMGATSSPVKRIKGGDEFDLLDPIQNIVKNVYHFTNLAEQNKVANMLARRIDAAPLEIQAEWGHKIRTPIQGFRADKDIETFLVNLGLDKESAQTLSQNFHFFRPALFSKQDFSFSFMKNGKRQFYKLNPFLYETMEGLNSEASMQSIKLAAAFAKMLRAGAVLNPDFITKNPVRDLFVAATQGAFGTTHPGDFIKGLISVVSKDRFYWQDKNLGGLQASLVSLDRDYLGSVVKKAVRPGATRSERAVSMFKERATYNPFEWLRGMSELMEEVNRVGQFRKVLKKTNDPYLAAYESREITLDFGRAGKYGRSFNKYIAFFNATLQGSDKMIRAFKRQPLAFSARAIGTITVPTVILYSINHDNPDYWEVPRWQRDLFWLVPYGKKEIGGKKVTQFLRVPKPFELGVIFGTSVERALKWAMDKDPDAFKGFNTTITETFLPNFIPTFAQPPLEVVTNWSLFFGRNIVNKADLKVEPWLQYTSRTPESIKKASKLLDDAKVFKRIPFGIGEFIEKQLSSPAKLEHLTVGWTAGLGRYGIMAIDDLLGRTNVIPEKPSVPSHSIAEKIPGIKTFVAAWPAANAESIQNFYDLYGEIEKKYASYQKMKAQRLPEAADYYEENYRYIKRYLSSRDEDGNILRYGAYDIAKRLAALRESVTVIAESDLSDDEKRETLDLLYWSMIGWAQRGNLELESYIKGGK